MAPRRTAGAGSVLRVLTPPVPTRILPALMTFANRSNRNFNSPNPGEEGRLLP